MNKLTAEVARREISQMKKYHKPWRSLREDRYLQALEIALPVLEQQEKPSGTWTVWNGGDCPVADYQQVEVRLSDNGMTRGRASNFGWENRTAQGFISIIAYRVVEQERERGEEE